MKLKTGILASASMMAFAAAAFTTASVPQNGVYRFTFGVSETQDGSIPVPASAVCDVNDTMEEGQFSYGFLGTTDDSYKNDVPSSLPTVPHAIDGFKVVKGQKIVLHDTTDANGVPCVTGPAASEYLPSGASSFEGRYPIRFSMRAEERAYYAVTCTVANASSTANADVTLFSERCHTHVQHLVLAPGETKTFAWSVELAPNYFKTPKKAYDDNAVNVVVVGENAALASLTVVKQPQTAGTVRGDAVANMNVGRTMWLCDDSTGTDQRCDTPYFTLQNYSGVGSGLSRWAPANLSIRNQGEGGLATGANTHRKSCLLKPGDYLYVEYGHNEASTESYTNNLETYLADANEAGANLVIVSPLERHYTWDDDNSKWNRTLQGYAEAGEAWVEAKIAAGATNVAFIDLNKPFADWMNAELVRINGINPSIPLKNAIDYYFFSAKGGKVDATHPNPAGSDWGAYFVWSNALERVAAGEAEGATDSQRIQAAVLKGITEGVLLKVGLNGTADNTPWRVSDEIITAGKASNSYWDATVRAGYDYAKDAAVAAVDASCENGVVTLRGVTMRVMNRLNYTKAVIDIVSADGATTNRWYSFYNYDASGNASGDLVVPEVGGFIDVDLDKDDAGIAAHVSQALTLANSGFANPLKSTMTNTVNIVMTAGTTNHFKTVGTENDDPGIYVRGNISGEGCYQINLAKVRMCNAYFYGNNNDFRGDGYTTGGKDNRSVIYWSENAVGTNAFLHIGHSYGTYNSDSYRMGGSVKFGGVEGGWWDRYDGNVLTIGYLNRDSSINLSNGVSGRANSVAKVGTANLTLGTTRIKNLTVGEGSVTMPIGIAPQTLSIAEGAKVIIPGDASWTAGTVTNLFSYATLAGAGTLAQQVEVTGLAEGLVAKIAVADNTVTATIEAAEVAPTTNDENATITKNGDGSYTVEVTAETVAITVPDGVTVSEVVVSPDTATVTGVPANATVKVAVSWADAQETQHSVAYAIVKVNSETGAVSLDEDAVVTVGDEEISLRPELSDAGDEVAPLDVGEDVSVGVKSIPGLIYSLARGTAPNEIDMSAANVVAEEKAISSRVSLVDGDPPSNGAFYKVTVDMKVRHGTF